ncbi:MAG: TolC family protein [Bacteroidales bacterium]|nr:TolC family protein [Bacteroidales bacterium]
MVKTVYVYLFFLLPGFFISPEVRGQAYDTLTLPECFRLATERFPLIAGKQILKKQISLEDKNLKSAFYPEMNLNAGATYYSDVVTISVEPAVPGVTFPQPHHDQYAVTMDIRQMIYDGGEIRNRQKVQERSNAVKQQDLEVKLYAYKQKLAKVFFSALYLDDNYKILERNLLQLRKATKEAEVAKEKGSILQGDVNILKASQLDIRQKMIANRHDRIAVVKILEIYLDTIFSEEMVLCVPAPVMTSGPPTRPEFRLFSLQQSWLDAGMQLQNVQRHPKLFGFGQAGYGRPGLNPLNENFNTFYLVGVNLTWNIWDWNRTKRQKKILSFEQELVKNRKKWFDQQVNADLVKINEEIEKLEKIIELDKQRVLLRKEITEEYAGKLSGGTITPAEYEQQLTAWQDSQVQLNLHQKQLMEKHIDYLVTNGNLKDYETQK